MGARLKAEWGCAFYRLFARLEKLALPSYTRCVSIDGLESSAEGGAASRGDVPAEEGLETFTPEDIDLIRSHELDVIIQIGFTIFLRGDILDCAKSGVWFLRHCDNYQVRGNPSGFWEVFLGLPVTGSLLERRTADPYAGFALVRSWSSTNQVSALNNRNKFFWKTKAFIPRALKSLHHFGNDAFMKKAEALNSVVDSYDGPWFRTPGNGVFLRRFPAYAYRSIKCVLRKRLFHEHWKLSVHVGQGPSATFRDFKSLQPPKGKFWADPFVVQENDRSTIFFEECDQGGSKAHISAIVLQDDGTFSPPVTVLERDHHLSYPMVFSYEGTWYMVPDASANGSIDVYRCDEFPATWSYHATLMNDIRAADPTVFEHNGRWWMMVTIKEHSATSYWDELFLFSSNDPLSSDWRSHPMNPIVSDVRKARPAGAVFNQKGTLIRVSQNCSQGYGYGINFHEIVTLTEAHYEEKDLQQVGPNWNPSVKGLHTWSTAGDVTCIDEKSYRFKWL